MSQRLHNCLNNINMDTVHSDAYSARFPKRGKQDFVASNRLSLQNKRERSISRSRPNAPIYAPNMPVAKAKSLNVRQANDFKSESTSPSVIHRELYTDNPAMVEVTVKTHNAKQRPDGNSRSTSRSRSREPWSKLLKQHPSNEGLLPSFHNFDPLRTIHFLAKEIQSKLGETNDRTVLQMIVEMQQALVRIPPEVASSVLLNSPREQQKRNSYIDLKQLNAKNTIKETEEPPSTDKQMVVVKPATRESSCQTQKNTYESEKLQKHLEESSAKIETACKQMETVCTRLKSEKEELEIMLKAERETVKFLRKQMDDFDSEKTESTNTKVLILQQEKDNLQCQLKKLREKLESQQNVSSIDLKTLVQDLRKQKTEAEEQIALMNHQLTLVSMEKEKYVAILSARDRQIKEIRCEMTQLQEVVNEQLVELQNAPCSSVPSSITNMTSEQPQWLPMKSDNHKKNDVTENMTISSINTNETALEQLFMKEKVPACSFKELPSGDSSGTTVITEVKKTMKNRKCSEKNIHKANEKSSENIISDTHANIRDMFAEIKKQALLVTAPGQKMNDIDAYHGEQKKST